MSWQDAVERTVTGLGYDLVDATKSAGGLLCVFIDHPATGDGGTGSAERFITVDDCEQVTRQLQHVLEVDGVSYERLEVSSPGLDRPLKKPADYARFVGEQIELTLKVPFKGRKRYRGELVENADGWRLLLADASANKVGSVGRKKASPRKSAGAPAAAAAPAAEPAPAELALDFSLEEVRDAHLVPVVDFKGRRTTASPAGRGNGASGFDLQPAASAYPNDGVDGGRIQ